MTDPTPRTPVSRWLKIALVTSLGVNLLIGGVVIGAIANGPPERRVSDSARGDLPYVRALSRQDRRALRRAMNESLRTAPEPLARPADGYDSAVAILRADPFDAGAMEILFATQGRQVQTRARLGQRLLLQHISDMTPAQRREYADRLEQAALDLSKRTRNQHRSPD